MEQRNYHYYLHSHSALECELKFPKNKVLVDIQYGEKFPDKEMLVHDRTKYYIVPIMDFVKAGGIFKRLKE